MDKKNQIRIIGELCANLRSHLLSEASKIPAHWDGLELREWTCDVAKETLASPNVDRRGARWRDYENDRLILNI